jgi:hypothetical protein
MKLSTILIVLLISLSIITGIYVFINELAEDTSFDVTVNQSYLNSFNQSNEINNELNLRYNKLTSVNLSANTGSAFQIITLIPDVLIIVKKSLALPFILGYEFLESFQTYLGAPTWVFNLFIGLLIISLIYAFISLVIGRDS